VLIISGLVLQSQVFGVNKAEAVVQNCAASNPQSIWGIPKAPKTIKKSFTADIKLTGNQGLATNDSIKIEISNYHAPDLSGTGYIANTSMDSFKEPINSGLENVVHTKTNYFISRCNKPADTVLGSGNKDSLKQNGHLGSDSGNVSGNDGEGNPQHAYRYDLYMVVGERGSPNKYYTIGPISTNYDPAISSMAAGIALAKPTKMSDTNGQVGMSFYVSPTGDADKYEYCYITVHQKSDSKGAGDSSASQYLYTDSPPGTTTDDTCRGYPFAADKPSVKKTLTFNLMKEGLTKTTLPGGKIKYVSYFISYAPHNAASLTKNKSFASNVQTVEYTWDPVTKTGEFNATDDSIIDPPGGDAPGGSGPGDECPLTSSADGWIQKKILLEPICVATNLIASAATAIAAWTITTFFVPALGLT